MKTGTHCIALIKHFEGFRAHPYICPGGVPTIGYGHAILPGENFSEITEGVAEEILRADLARAEATVRDLVEVYLCQHMFDALVAFIYNVGAGAFANSTLLRLLNKGDYLGAADQFGRWVYAGRKKLSGLVSRREAEKELFISNAA